MKKSLLLATALLLVCNTPLARAKDVPSSFSGTWVNDNIRSTWSDGHYPTGKMKLEMTVNIIGDHIVYHSVNSTLKGKPPMVIDFDATMDGKLYALSGSGRYDTVRVRRLENNRIEILEMKNDDLIVGAIWTLEDGDKTLMRWGIGKSPEGKSKAYQEFFTRQ